MNTITVKVVFSFDPTGFTSDEYEIFHVNKWFVNHIDWQGVLTERFSDCHYVSLISVKVI